MSDNYHLHCEAHDEEIGHIQRYSGTLARLWEKRQLVIDFVDAFVIPLNEDFVTELNWEYKGSDHNFEDSFEAVAEWMRKHNDCPVYVYMYGHRADDCGGQVVCESCETLHACRLSQGHDGDHSRVRPA